MSLFAFARRLKTCKTGNTECLNTFSVHHNNRQIYEICWRDTSVWIESCS